MKKIIICLLALCSCVVNANSVTQDIDSLIESFTHCDADFFSIIAENKNTLKPYVQITPTNHNQAYIAVEDRTDSKKNYLLFNKPIQYRSLQLIGYYDSQLNLGKYGDYYFWGFIVDNSLQDIRSSLNFLPWLEMEKDVFYTTNTKMHYADESLNIWHDNPNTITGVKTVPLQGTAEKLLFLEKNEDMTILVCSIQGFFPPELLAVIRPDLDDIQHIAPLQSN